MTEFQRKRSSFFEVREMVVADTIVWGCAQVTYFKQRRVMEFKKKQTMEQLAKEGASAVPEGMPLPGGQGKPPA